MKNIEHKYGIEIHRIMKRVFIRNAQYQVEEIFPKITASAFFNSATELGNHKYKQTVIEIYGEVNKITEKHLKLSYIPGNEFERFPRYADIWIAIINSLEELDTKKYTAVILPFKKTTKR